MKKKIVRMAPALLEQRPVLAQCKTRAWKHTSLHSDTSLNTFPTFFVSPQESSNLLFLVLLAGRTEWCHVQQLLEVYPGCFADKVSNQLFHFDHFSLPPFSQICPLMTSFFIIKQVWYVHQEFLIRSVNQINTCPALLTDFGLLSGLTSK